MNTENKPNKASIWRQTSILISLNDTVLENGRFGEITQSY